MTLRPYRIHFVGIGGIGMSGIAELFLIQGHRVSGSDLQATEITERLVRLGAVCGVGHDAAQVKDAEVVVISSAVRSDNPEVLEAKRRGIPVIPRAEMLAELMRGKLGIAIAGTHGKTTTTSMTAQILIQAGMDPTVVVGGKVEAIGSNAKMGIGNAVVVEADESDGSFQYLPMTYSVITNIDSDHMEYFKTLDRLEDAFVQFTKKTPFFGKTWLCGDDGGVRSILPKITKPCSTYGFQAQNDLIASAPVVSNGRQTFQVFLKGSCLGTVTLAVLGEHNVLNALGAMGVAMSAGASFESVQKALSTFSHVRRRFDERYFNPNRSIRVIDDYGHHPTEIRAVLATARQLNPKRMVVIFQPHRYTRTQNSFQEFLNCFNQADVVMILPIYAANEDPIAGINSEAMVEGVKTQAQHLKLNLNVFTVPNLDEACEQAKKMLQDGDIILTLGAGTITKLSTSLCEAFSSLR